MSKLVWSKIVEMVTNGQTWSGMVKIVREVVKILREVVKIVREVVKLYERWSKLFARKFLFS